MFYKKTTFVTENPLDVMNKQLKKLMDYAVLKELMPNSRSHILRFTRLHVGYMGTQNS